MWLRHWTLWHIKRPPPGLWFRKEALHAGLQFFKWFFFNINAMICTCGYEDCAPGHSYGSIMRNGYLIHSVLKGSGIYKARGKISAWKKETPFWSARTSWFIMKRISCPKTRIWLWTVLCMNIFSFLPANFQTLIFYSAKKNRLRGRGVKIYRRPLLWFHYGPGYRRPSEHEPLLPPPPVQVIYRCFYSELSVRLPDPSGMHPFTKYIPVGPLRRTHRNLCGSPLFYQNLLPEDGNQSKGI